MITKCATDKSHFEAFCHLRIQSECGKNADQNNFKCGHSLRSVLSSNLNVSLAQIYNLIKRIHRYLNKVFKLRTEYDGLNILELPRRHTT